MASMDTFKADAFSMISLSARVNKLPYVPGQIGRMGLFEESGVRTTTLQVEEHNNTIKLIPTSKRGSAGVANAHDKRGMRNFTALHLQDNDHITADDIQNIRAWGSESELDQVQSEVDRRMMRQFKKLDATLEYQRVKAIQGQLLDADGTTVLYNLFTEFGVAQQTLDMLLGTTTTDQLSNCTDVRGLIQDDLGADGGEDIEMVAICGSTFFKRFISHTAVKDAYKYYEANGQNQQPLREDLRYKGFKFGGITWKQYRGSVGGILYVPASEAYVFPLGVPEMFVTTYSPADYVDTVNTVGLPRYAHAAIDPLHGKYVDLEVQSNPLSINTRPRSTVKLTTSN